MAWGKKLLLSLSVFAIMLRKRLPDGSKMKRLLPGWFESLMILAALLLQRKISDWVKEVPWASRTMPETTMMAIIKSLAAVKKFCTL